MSEFNSHESDLVLGGQTPPPTNAAILGGLAGVKQRLASESISERLLALNDAVWYGEHAIDLALQALADEAHQVRRLAKRLLRDRLGEAGKAALLDRDPMDYFTIFNDWNQEIYNPEVGLIDPENNAYLVRISCSSENFDASNFEFLLEEPNIEHLQALIVKIDLEHINSLDNDLDYDLWWKIFAVIHGTSALNNLKALYIGDEIFDRNPISYQQSGLVVLDLSSILEKFSNLEILHIYGNFKLYYLVDTYLKHEKLKTFIIDPKCLNRIIDSLCPLNMPELEYFACLLNFETHSDREIEAMWPLLSGSAAPRLRYLSLHQYSGNIIKQIAKMPIFKDIAVLAITIQYNDNLVVEEITKSLTDSNLKLLNVHFYLDSYDNSMFSHLIDKFLQLPVRVEINEKYYTWRARLNVSNRYYRSYE